MSLHLGENGQTSGRFLQVKRFVLSSLLYCHQHSVVGGRHIHTSCPKELLVKHRGSFRKLSRGGEC